MGESTLRGLFGRPYVDLGPYLNTSAFGAIDDEICLGLCEVATGYTGGSHRSMGIMPPSLAAGPYVDYGEVIAGMGEGEFRRFCALGGAGGAETGRGEIGEERAVSLGRKQMLYLNYRHGVYFPWKVFYQFIPTDYWHEKSSGAGKAFTAEARALFPQTVAFVRSLPFREIGRCNLMGLEANDEGTVHRDGDPAEQGEPDHFVTFCPGRRDKRLYLWDEPRRQKTFVRGRAYWFNDFDYHGVEPDPYFRYSIRVDGVFEPSFLRHLGRQMARAG